MTFFSTLNKNLNLKKNCFFFFFEDWDFCDESCRGDFQPTSPNGLKLVGQTDFCVIDEDFEIN